jgi:hypothetical protein
MGTAERKWTGYHGLDGAFVVQRNSAGDACETTWGTIAWLEPKDWADADGGDGGNIVVSPTTSPRLPSLTLARLWEDLRPRGWTLQEKPIHASHLHGSGGCFVVLSSIRGLVPVASWLDEDVTHPLWNQVGNYPACLRTLRERLWQSPYPPVTQGEGPLEGL